MIDPGHSLRIPRIEPQQGAEPVRLPGGVTVDLQPVGVVHRQIHAAIVVEIPPHHGARRLHVGKEQLLRKAAAAGPLAGHLLTVEHGSVIGILRHIEAAVAVEIGPGHAALLRSVRRQLTGLQLKRRMTRNRGRGQDQQHQTSTRRGGCAPPRSESCNREITHNETPLLFPRPTKPLTGRNRLRTVHLV